MKHMIIALACLAYFAGVANAQTTQAPAANPFPSVEPKAVTPAQPQDNKNVKSPQDQVKAPVKDQTK